MLSLPDVTLCCVYTVAHELHQMAIEECLKRVKFGDVKLFSDQKFYSATTLIKPFADGKAAGEFISNYVPSQVKTSHALFIQWDSWVIDTDMWYDEFLHYDYIGAPWWYKDNFNVGNSGFCLRSTALMRYLAENRGRFPIGTREDHTLCREQQTYLPQFKWAPEPVAARFAFERSRPAIDSRHFGFHGIFNWPFVLNPHDLSARMKVARNDNYITGTDQLPHIYEVAKRNWSKLG